MKQLEEAQAQANNVEAQAHANYVEAQAHANYVEAQAHANYVEAQAHANNALIRFQSENCKNKEFVKETKSVNKLQCIAVNRARKKTPKCYIFYLNNDIQVDRFKILAS